MVYRRRRADIVGKELLPYGSNESDPEAETPLRFKDRAADELAWRRRQSGSFEGKADRRKAGRKDASLPRKPEARPIPIQKNAVGIKAGYDPYDSGELIKRKKTGVRRNLRELGRWLKTQPRPKQRPQP